MPAPFDYNVQRPDIMGAIGAYEAGRDRNRQMMQQNKQDMFAQYLPGALKGDQQALQGAQQNATPEQQMQLQNALAQMEDRQLQQTLQQQEKFSRLAQWADTPEKWAQATQMAEAEGLQGAAQIPFEQRGAKLAGMLSVKDQLDQEWKRREFALKQSVAKADINQSNAAADYSRRRAAAPAAQGGVSVDPETGALVVTPGMSDMKFTEGQSKDIGYLNRATAANAKLDADRTAALVSSKNLGRNVPFVGNALQSSSSRQGGQIGKDFIAAVLRKDTGAAVTEQEFEFYSDIFLPQWGDDAAAIALKEQSRRAFLDGMRSGMSNGATLARMGVIAPPDLAAASGTDAPAPTPPPPPPGFRISQ